MSGSMNRRLAIRAFALSPFAVLFGLSRGAVAAPPPSPAAGPPYGVPRILKVTWHGLLRVNAPLSEDGDYTIDERGVIRAYCKLRKGTIVVLEDYQNGVLQGHTEFKIPKDIPAMAPLHMIHGL